MFDLAASSQILGILDSMNCWVLSVEEAPLNLVTSDALYGRGFAHKSVEVSVLLSRSKLLIFSHSGTTHPSLSRNLVSVDDCGRSYTPETSEDFLEGLELLQRSI